jgi:hypothetical protein
MLIERRDGNAAVDVNRPVHCVGSRLRNGSWRARNSPPRDFTEPRPASSWGAQARRACAEVRIIKCPNSCAATRPSSTATSVLAACQPRDAVNVHGRQDAARSANDEGHTERGGGLLASGSLAHDRRPEPRSRPWQPVLKAGTDNPRDRKAPRNSTPVVYLGFSMR